MDNMGGIHVKDMDSIDIRATHLRRTGSICKLWEVAPRGYRCARRTWRKNAAR